MEPQGSKGPLVAIVIVVLILIAGGIYMMQSRGTTAPATSEATPSVTEEAKSDEVSTLEADAEASLGVEELDADFSELDQELGS